MKIKNIFPILLAMFLISLFFWPQSKSIGAGMATGHTWTNGEVMTATKLNNMVNQGSVTNITTGDFADLAVTLAKLAVDSVNSSKIVNLSIIGGVGGDIAYGTIESTNILAGTFNGREFGTTVTFTNATAALNFNTNQILAPYVQGTNLGGTATQAALIPKLNNAGKIDPSMAYGATNGQTFISGDVASASSYTTLASYTTVATNGSVAIFANATYARTSGDAGPFSLRVVDGSGTVIFLSTLDDIGGDPIVVPIIAFGKDSLTGSAKTYTLSAASGVGAIGNWVRNTTLGTFGATNASQLLVIEFPKP